MMPSSESQSLSFIKLIRCHQWNCKCHYDAQKSLLLVSILSQMNPFHIFTSCICNIHFNSISLTTTKRRSGVCKKTSEFDLCLQAY